MAGQSVTRGFLLAASITVTLGTEAAEVYQWTDENGRTVFSSSAPGDRPSSKTTVKVPPSKPPAARTAPAIQTGGEPTAPRSPLPAPPAAEDPSVAAHNCAEARRVLQVLETTPRPRFTDTDGQIKFMDEQQKAERRTEARQQMEENCR